MKTIKSLLGLFHGVFASKEEYEKDVSNLDIRLGRIMGNILGLLTERAIEQGDIHEFNHCIAVIALGDSNHSSQTYTCPLPIDTPIRPEDILLYQFPKLDEAK